MSNNIRTLTIYFDNEISHHEIPLFRGAILNILGDKANILFHNHTGETTFRYAYPLIQYKRIHGKAAIVCIGEGTDQIGQLLSMYSADIDLGKRTVQLEIDKILPRRTLVQRWQEPIEYHITNWLPLNSKNYLLFKQTENEEEKKKILEDILTANILSMLKGLGIRIDDEIIVTIQSLEGPWILHNKGVGLTSFNADFKCNLSMPDNIGIGKNSSIGFGRIYQRRKESENDNNL